jgi:hypothetical protein
VGEGDWTVTDEADVTVPYTAGADTFIQVRTVKATGDSSKVNVFHSSLHPSDAWCVPPE